MIRLRVGRRGGPAPTHSQANETCDRPSTGKIAYAAILRRVRDVLCR